MLNPITYSERVVGDFLRYQLTTYPFADGRLHAQMRALLNLEVTRATPLMRGPYISLSRAFRRGARVSELVHEGLLHPHLQALAPHPHVYGHQEAALRAISRRQSTLVSTGTGSGKTESFLYPIISHCLRLRDERVPEGICAVLVYPMNALAEDQLGRLRQLLCGTGVSFGMYVGKTPERTRDVAGVRLDAGASAGDYARTLERLRARKDHAAVLPPEERASREEMRAPGGRPRILLTNVKQLELLLTRQQDVELFEGARLDFLVFDEAHTFSGAPGAETACLIRRLRSFCGRSPEETVCVATSATIADPERGREAGRDFAARFFGVDPDGVALVGEEYEPDVWTERRTPSGALPGNPSVQLQTLLEALVGVEKAPDSKEALQALKIAFQTMTGSKLDTARWEESLHERLSANEVVFQIADALTVPRAMAELVRDLERRLGRPVPEEEVIAWLALGAASRREGRPLLRPVVHAFVRGVGGAVVTFPEGQEGPRLWLSREDAASAEEAGARGADGGESRRRVQLDVMTCTTCGQHYFSHWLADFDFTGRAPGGGEAVEDRRVWKPLEQKSGGCRMVLLDRLVSEAEDEDGEDPRNTSPVHLCRRCGSVHPEGVARCDGCGAPGSLVPLFAVGQKEEQSGKLTSCLACQARGRMMPGGYREPARPVRAQNVSDVHVLAQSMLQHGERKRLLIFSDNRQDAAFQAGWMQDHARRFRLRALMHEQFRRGAISVGDLAGVLDDLLERDDDLSRSLIPEVWRVERKETAGTRHANERRRFLRYQVLREVATGPRQRLGLEPWGRLRVEYVGLEPKLPFFTRWAARLGCEPEVLHAGVASLLDVTRRTGILYDREGRMFSRYWHESDFEVMRGYVPLLSGGPKALKLRRAPSDVPGRVSQLLSSRGLGRPSHVATRWGVGAEDLEMELQDLQLLAMGRSGEVEPDILIYDPMPGGSGLLEQMVSRWGEVVRKALELVEGCPSRCASACVDCLLHYRNTFYHSNLDRHVAARLLRERGEGLVASHDIPPRLPNPPSQAQPVNEPESVLRRMLARAGFPQAEPQHPIDLGRPLGTTTPDFFFEDASGRTEGVCIYLDGMSEALHGDAATRKKDRAIREELLSLGYEVIEVTFGDLSDRDAMRRHLARLGRTMIGKERAMALREDDSWFWGVDAPETPE